MSGYLQIDSNATALAIALGDLTAKQVPFATALALTDVAFKVQRGEKTELARSMELRNRFSTSGIQVNPAERNDWPVTYAEVGIEQRRSYLIDHALGGKRQGGTHGRAIIEDESMRSGSGRVPAGKRPKALIAKAMKAKRQNDARSAFGGKVKDKRLPFLFFSKKWGNEVLAQRTGKERTPLRIVYAFRKGVSIRKEFDMELVGQSVIAMTYHQAFTKALNRAIASGKGAGERRASTSRGVDIG